MKLKNKIKIFKIFITVIFIIFFLIYFYINKEDFIKAFRIDYKFLFVLLFIVTITFYLNGLFLKIIIKKFGINLNFLEFFGLSIISSWWNYFFPLRAGAGIRAFYLKKKYGFSYRNFFDIFLANYLIVFFISSLVWLVFFIAFMFLGFFEIKIFLFVLFLFISLTFFLIILSKKPLKFKLANKNIYFNKNLKKIIEDKKLFCKLSLISFLNLVLSVFLIYFQFKAISLNINLFKSMVLSIFLNFSTLLGITPGGFGVAETFYMFYSKFIGVTNEQILLMSFIGRAVVLVFLTLTAPLFFFLLLRKNE